MLPTIHFIIFPAVIASIAAQWHHDVIHSEYTCENLVIAYPSCLHSASCISDYFLECKCVPKVLKDMFDYSGGGMDGHTLCLYATFTLEVGEPRCCDFYKRDVFLKRPNYMLTVSGINIPKQVGTRSSESTSASGQISGESNVDSILPESPLERLIDYGRQLYGDVNNDTEDRAKDNGLKIRGSKRALSKTRSLNKRSKLIKALRCFPVVQDDEMATGEAGYECLSSA